MTTKKKSKLSKARRYGVSLTALDMERINHIRRLHETTVSGAVRLALKQFVPSPPLKA